MTEKADKTHRVSHERESNTAGFVSSYAKDLMFIVVLFEESLQQQATSQPKNAGTKPWTNIALNVLAVILGSTFSDCRRLVCLH